MRRREFIAGLGSAAALPLVARAQQQAIPAIGFLNVGSARQNARYISEFLQNLEKAGYVEGKNVTIEYRWGDGQPARLAEFAADLVSRQVSVIVAIDTPSIRTAKAVSMTIPIVFLLVGDPVKDGFVASLNRPGGNMTGVSTLSTELLTKRLEWLRKIVPKGMTIAYLTTPVPGSPTAEEETNEVLAAASALGQRVVVVEVRNVRDIDAAFMTFTQGGVDALLLPNRVMFSSNRDKLLALAARHRIPACYFDRGWVLRGGLMSYSADPVPLSPVIADYVARILKGTKPMDLPVQQPTKFDLVINLKTAKALGLTIPETLLAIADEVIQ
jgi:putative ABC transport system substrate-binding protein